MAITVRISSCSRQNYLQFLHELPVDLHIKYPAIILGQWLTGIVFDDISFIGAVPKFIYEIFY